MPSQVIAIALIFLSAIPGFAAKDRLVNSLTEDLLGKPAQIQTQGIDGGKVVIPLKTDPMAQATVGAKSAYFIDYDSGEVLYAKNENEKLPMASTTKLMTALIATRDLDQNKVLTVGQINTLPLDSVMGLAPGDKVKVSELMHGLLIESGADAASVLAQAAAGNETKFVAQMNEMAAQFGLSNTQFTNVVGEDDQGHYSTAKDLAALARLALSNPQIAQIVSEPSHTATAEGGKTYPLLNTNLLLSDPNYKGVKTGTTTAAGECFISLYNDGQRKILGVVLASPDRFGETQNMISWTKQAFLW